MQIGWQASKVSQQLTKYVRVVDVLVFRQGQGGRLVGAVGFGKITKKRFQGRARLSLKFIKKIQTVLACVVSTSIIRSQRKIGAIQLHTSPTGAVMGQVQSVTIQPHTSPIGGVMGARSLWPDCCSHGAGSISDHPTTYILNWWSHGAGSLWPVGRFCTFMKQTFVSKNTNLNGSRFSFLKRKFGFRFKTQTQFWYDSGQCFFWDKILPNFDLKNIILTQWIFY